jgi:methyl-accepting chemotaxis protein
VAQELFKKLQVSSLRASRVTGNVVSGDDEGDDDEEDHISASSETGSNEILEELEELASVILRIRNKLGDLLTNASDVEHLLENATVLMEEAKALAMENPDEAEELIEAVEDMLEEAMDLIEGTAETENNMSEIAFEPYEGDDDDEKDESD